MENTQPYKDFGKELRRLRAEAKKSVMDMSGAFEYDLNQMERIEAGQERPTEELIVLIISHFDLDETAAVKLWDLAGYNQPDADSGETEATPVLLPMSEAKIIYTDMVNVNANNYGVVVNFLQSLGGNSQPMAVSRVGMSLEHAESFMKVLEKTIGQVRNQQADAKKTDGKKDSTQSEMFDATEES